jgi:peptidoglycan/xylan/chitin deacetylase (PgdA/CDA1 family)
MSLGTRNDVPSIERETTAGCERPPAADEAATGRASRSAPAPPASGGGRARGRAASAAYAAMRAYQRARVWRAARGPAPTWDGVRILGYHRIDGRRESLSVSPEAFRRQMEDVVESGATPVRLADALDLLAQPVAGRYIAVTFDDGYLDNVTHAEPVLAELGIPGTIFLPTQIIDGTRGYDWFAEPVEALGWDEVDAAARRGVFDFQSHGCSHIWMTSADHRRAWTELCDSRERIEERIGRPVTVMAYPAGMYSTRDAALAEQAGYRAAVTTRPGVNRGGGCRMLELARTMVFWEDGPREFGLKLAGRLDTMPWLRTAYYRLAARRGRSEPSGVWHLPRRGV